MQKKQKMIITNKGDGKHFYVCINDITYDCLNIKWRYYKAKHVLKEWLRAIGEPLRSKDFILVE